MLRKLRTAAPGRRTVLPLFPGLLALAGWSRRPAWAQQQAPDPFSAPPGGPGRTAFTREQANGYTVEFSEPEPGRFNCRLSGPSSSPFGMAMTMWSDGRLFLSLTNTAWNLGQGSKGLVALRMEARTLTAEFTQDSPTGMTTGPITDERDADFVDHLLSGGRLVVAEFPNGPSYRFVTPAGDVGNSVERCMAHLRSRLRGPSDPFATPR